MLYSALKVFVFFIFVVGNSNINKKLNSNYQFRGFYNLKNTISIPFDIIFSCLFWWRTTLRVRKSFDREYHPMFSYSGMKVNKTIISFKISMTQIQ